MNCCEIAMLLVNGVLAVVLAVATMYAIVFFAKVAVKSRPMMIYVGLSLILFGCLAKDLFQRKVDFPVGKLTVFHRYLAAFYASAGFHDNMVAFVKLCVVGIKIIDFSDFLESDSNNDCHSILQLVSSQHRAEPRAVKIQVDVIFQDIPCFLNLKEESLKTFF